MYKAYLLISVLIISGCDSGKSVFVNPVYVSPEYVEHETLIKVYDRTATSGEMCFLAKKDDKCEYWEFIYGTDPKNRKAFCKLTDKRTYQIGDEDIPYYSWWETATGLVRNNNNRGKNHNKYFEKCLNCLASKFLQLSNDEKLDVMKSYSRVSEFYHTSSDKITWLNKNLVVDECLDDTCQIISSKIGEWNTLTLMKEYVVDEKRLLVLILESGSGISFSNIYVFKRDNLNWVLAAEGTMINQHNLFGPNDCFLTPEISSDNKKIEFRTRELNDNMKIKFEIKEIICGDNKKIKYRVLTRLPRLQQQNANTKIIGELNIDDL